MERIYRKIMDDHLINDREMIFLASPQQVGKTTICKTEKAFLSQLV